MKNQLEFFSLADAKAKLSEVLKRVQQKDVVITKNGVPAAVLIDYERYRKIMNFLDQVYDLYLLDVGDPSAHGSVNQRELFQEDIEEV
ncbi:MAG: type II toxin-antitoxin system Phd/YefM family antitoxin [Pseudothermotoga sp.]|mgnify:CR=1 FL=1|uniref:Antitoxin n=2 Tax=Pseudothermotoga hypogea TaxID=57487 RepID=A0A0X1KPI5_9THEM|nr:MULTISPECIES: type II toxin-antitoxin system Phd/YefM family antitoxin [Pseudothermotoga]AJC73163.1 prevent-host-death protein [Pseudothermotoga hypogea DSM 11164 = NBRC 106472]MBC7116323.1 type II toxin-antitoxin system Phd/YefM family antitoxin [Pseudothermotoga sp.]MBC7122937.1 type II toxin-antitoxin system Phd/YefM family antitoxin [Pseudothermotoga sp.]MDI6861840.1 type II toxin-antitoxin system Phd/YefM family antitoxin [Pseudothermotoga sp.]